MRSLLVQMYVTGWPSQYLRSEKESPPGSFERYTYEDVSLNQRLATPDETYLQGEGIKIQIAVTEVKAEVVLGGYGDFLPVLLICKPAPSAVGVALELLNMAIVLSSKQRKHVVFGLFRIPSREFTRLALERGYVHIVHRCSDGVHKHQLGRTEKMPQGRRTGDERRKRPWLVAVDVLLQTGVDEVYELQGRCSAIWQMIPD